MQVKITNIIQHMLVNKYTLWLSAMVVLASCRKTEVINRIENVVELGTFDNSTFLANTNDERALLNNYQTLLNAIAEGESGSFQDSMDLKKSKTLDAATLDGLLKNTTGSLSVPTLATAEYKSWIIDDPSYMQKIAVASANSHYNPKESPTTPGGRYRQYNGFLFDEQGFDTYEVAKNAFLAISYQRVFKDLLTPEKASLANVDKALALYGAPTSFPNGFKTVSTNGNMVADRFAAHYAAQRDNAYGTAQGGYYSIIKTQFITLQKQLKTNALNATAVTKNIDSIRVNWEKALMASAIHHLDLAASNISVGATNDSLYAQALHNVSIGTSIIRSFKGITAPKVISDTDVKQILEMLYSSSANETIKEPDRLQNAINSLRTIYNYSSIQIGDYFKKNDINNRDIGVRRY